MLLAAGVADDHRLRPRRRDPSRPQTRPRTRPRRAYAETTNPAASRGTADEVLAGADVFIGLSGPGAVTRWTAIRAMAPDAIVFAMANPTPEVPPEEIEELVAVVATGRSDYPNQINNVLAFPGIFRGALDVRASEITEEMELAPPRDRGRRRRGRARRRLHRPERVQPRRRSGGGRSGGECGRGRRRGPAHLDALTAE